MTKRKGASAMDRRPIFQNTSDSQDAGGGPILTVIEQWYQWAEITNAGGSVFSSQSQEIHTGDYRVRLRFDGRFKSTTRMIYEGQICKQTRMSVESEGYKEFLVLYFIKTDTWVDLS